MKDKTLFLLATMLIVIGLSSSVYAGTCKTGNPFVHTPGGCVDTITYTGDFCNDCIGDSDSGGCGTPLTAANVCVHTRVVHAHSNTYNWVRRGIYGYCIPVAGTATGGNGANTGKACKAKAETVAP
jgi:hypothetical protein